MNLALPAVALAIALIPGLVFRQAYLSGKLPREVTGLSPVAEFAQYVIWALPIDMLGHAVARAWILFPPLEYVLRVLSGDFALDGIALEQALASYTWWRLVAFYLFLVAASAGLGAICRRIVWASRWDVQFPFLRIKSDWYYSLNGRLAYLPRYVLPYVDVLTTHESRTRLYQGIVAGFEVSGDGSLRELILRDASRYHEAGDERDAGWKPIPGSQLILLAGTIQNLNLRYVSLLPDETNDWKAWFWSFWSQDP